MARGALPHRCRRPGACGCTCVTAGRGRRRLALHRAAEPNGVQHRRSFVSQCSGIQLFQNSRWRNFVFTSIDTRNSSKGKRSQPWLEPTGLFKCTMNCLCAQSPSPARPSTGQCGVGGALRGVGRVTCLSEACICCNASPKSCE